MHDWLRHKVEASTTNKIREFASVLRGVISGKYFSCKEKQILRRMKINKNKIKFMNMETITSFKAVNLG